MIKNDTFGNLVLGPKCIGPKYFRAEVGIRLKYSLGRNVPQAKVCIFGAAQTNLCPSYFVRALVSYLYHSHFLAL